MGIRTFALIATLTTSFIEMTIAYDTRLLHIAFFDYKNANIYSIIGCLTSYSDVNVLHLCIRFMNHRYINLPSRAKLLNILDTRLSELRSQCSPTTLGEIRTFIIKFKVIEIKDYQAYVHDYPEYNTQNFFTTDVLKDLITILRDDAVR
jgi:hypothetical protein